MDNRFPLYTSSRQPPPPSSAPSDYEDDDEDSRDSRSERSVRFPQYHHSILLVRENVFATPPGSPVPSNVFATPTSSRPTSPFSLGRSDSTLAPSVSSLRRDSSFSRRSPSPALVASGGYFPQHGASSSVTPSIISSSSSGYAGGLDRSNTVTTNTTNSSTLYSIPSQFSQFSSPPSPLPSIAPVRPRFDYGGHQQSIYPLSVHSNSDIGDHDPFADGFEIPVGDGFAPHNQRPPPSVASSGGLPPPPYSRYPDQPPPMQNEGVVAEIRLNPDSGVSMGEGDDGRRGGGGVVVAPVDGGGHYHNPVDDGSGAGKEWREKKWLGVKARLVIIGIVIGLLLSVGLGVGLGMGLGKEAASDISPTSVTLYPTSPGPPSPEQTGPKLSDPNDTFPDIKTGLAELTPLVLSGRASGCKIAPIYNSIPDFFNMGSDLLWTCHHSRDKPFLWQFDLFPEPSAFDMDSFPSRPNFLRGGEYGEGSWGGYILSSIEGIRKYKDNDQQVVVGGDGQAVEYSGLLGWRDGTQNPEFWHVPLAFYNTSTITARNRLKDRSGETRTYSGNAHYKVGFLYNKTVIFKRDTIYRTLEALKVGSGPPEFVDGTGLVEGEIVWKCVWEKTLLEIEVDINQPSLSCRPGGFAARPGDDDDASQDIPGPPPPPPHRVSPTASPIPPRYNSSIGSTDTPYKSADAPGFPKSKRTPPGPYPLKISIMESRPSSKRLRRVMGLDLTDPDPRGDAKPGQVKCTQMVVTGTGGLKAFVDSNGEGLVILNETMTLKKKRDSPPPPPPPPPGRDCFCRWTT